jgi:hypothetical protein
MAALTTSSTRTLKIKFNDDLRRVQVDLPSGASASEKLQTLRAAVGACFSMDIADLPALKYQDDDKDLCTLIEASVDDMLTLAPHGPLYLFASTTDGCNGISAEAPGTTDLADEVEFQEAVPADESESLIAPLLAMGFGEAAAVTAIEKAGGNLEVAVAILLKGNQPKQSSHPFWNMLPRFPGTADQPAVSQQSDNPNVDLPESETSLLSNSAVVEVESDANVHNQMDATMNEEIPEDTLLLQDETLQVESFGEASSLEDEAVEESNAELDDVERVSTSPGSDEAFCEGASEEAPVRAISASAMDKGQMLVSRLLSSIRTKQVVSERMPSSVVVDEESDINLRRAVEDATNDDIAVDTLQHLQHETEHVDSCEEFSAQEIEVVDESHPELSDAERTSVGLSSDEASFDGAVDEAFDRAEHASSLDKGQMLVSHIFSAIRSRNFVPENMNSSDVGKEGDVNLTGHVDNACAMDSFQHLHEQTDQVGVASLEQFLCQPPKFSGSVEGAASSEDVLVMEARAEHYDLERMSADSACEEVSFESAVGDAFKHATNASPFDKGQVFVSCLLSAVRTRQFIPESISSSGSHETSLDRVQMIVSDSLFALRSKIQRSALPQSA